jgi:hypothetical protein
MNTRLSRHQTVKVAHSRWLAYATATTATALAGGHSLEADIHYSGRLDVQFPCQRESCLSVRTFQLDQPGDSFVLRHYVNSYGGWNAVFVDGIASRSAGAVRGRSGYVSRLRSNQIISSGPFEQFGGYLVTFGENGRWKEPGYGIIGFSFNTGAGVQYGWARMRITFVGRDNIFKLVDYAYADPGEPLRAGQESRDERAPDQGSLGWLALGAVGLLAWRKGRSRRASSS